MIRSVLRYMPALCGTRLLRRASPIDLNPSCKESSASCVPNHPTGKQWPQCGMQTLYQRRESIARKFFMELLEPNTNLNHSLPQPRSVKYSLRQQTKLPRLRIPFMTKCFSNTLLLYGQCMDTTIWTLAPVNNLA